MSDAMHIQIALKAAPEAIFAALTERLPGWFAEHADVSLPEKRYDFWGRFTPETPNRAAGHHPLLAAEPNARLRYTWTLDSVPTEVEYRLVTEPSGTRLIVTHTRGTESHAVGNFSFEDFWFLSLENLRRHLDGRAPVFCDFSTLPETGDVRHTVEIDGSRAAVFEALIRPEQMNRWIASHARVDPRPGGEYDYGWNGVPPFKILEIVPNEKLSFTWPEDGDETVVTWTLAESGGKTRLTIVHSGFAPGKPNRGVQAGWLNFASWVRSVVEYGDDWLPAVLRIAPEMTSYYAASIGRAQSDLIPSPQ